MAEAEHVTLVDVAHHQLLEHVVERLGRGSGVKREPSMHAGCTMFRAWFECVMISVRCELNVCAMFETIWTAVSVLPVPGGPTTSVRPGFIAARRAST